jgi:hypothetical protein
LEFADEKRGEIVNYLDFDRQVVHQHNEGWFFRYFLGSGANGWLTSSLYDEHQQGHNRQPLKGLR